MPVLLRAIAQPEVSHIMGEKGGRGKKKKKKGRRIICMRNSIPPTTTATIRGGESKIRERILE